MEQGKTFLVKNLRDWSLKSHQNVSKQKIFITFQFTKSKLPIKSSIAIIFATAGELTA
jgi:hypothetical protein